MTSGKLSSRRRLQVSLEPGRRFVFIELDDDKKSPMSPIRRVRRFAGVMGGTTCPRTRRESNLIRMRSSNGLQDGDEALWFAHEGCESNSDDGRDCGQDFFNVRAWTVQIPRSALTLRVADLTLGQDELSADSGGQPSQGTDLGLPAGASPAGRAKAGEPRTNRTGGDAVRSCSPITPA